MPRDLRTDNEQVVYEVAVAAEIPDTLITVRVLGEPYDRFRLTPEGMEVGDGTEAPAVVTGEGGAPAGDYIEEGDARLTDDRTPTPNSVTDESLSTSQITHIPYVYTATTVGAARPVWAGSVIWICTYASFAEPTNTAVGDIVIDASGS
jgi:hypothetical protein